VNSNGVLAADKAGLHAHPERPHVRRPAQEGQDLLLFFLEYTQREETVFSQHGADIFGLVQATTQFLPGATYSEQVIRTRGSKIAGPGWSTSPRSTKFSWHGLKRGTRQFDFGRSQWILPVQGPFPPTATPGAQFPVPVACPAGQPLKTEPRAPTLGST